MARRIASVGRVTVSLRRSTLPWGTLTSGARGGQRRGGVPASLGGWPLPWAWLSSGARGGQRGGAVRGALQPREPVAERLQAAAVHRLAPLAPALAALLGQLGHQAPVGVHRLEAVGVG